MIPVIYYHSIAPNLNKNWTRYWLTLELKYFEEHLKYFKRHNYKTLFLDEYFELRENNSSDNYVVLTFDDGYLDNYIYVFPLLEKYGFKGTIFISPDFVNKRNVVRKTIKDYWNNKVSLNEIERWGFLSWEEMRIMQKTGVIDIQSHTMTHTKYFISDKIIGFHYPGRDCLYPIGNLYPEKRPYYIEYPNFEKLIPYGFPFFEEASSVIARKVEVNPVFIDQIIKKLSNFLFENEYNVEKFLSKINDIYSNCKKNDDIIIRLESKEEYQERVNKELKLSKEIIENQLEKKVNYLCWPHGDNNEFSHKRALELGYKATTVGKSQAKPSDINRFERIGLSKYKNSIFFTNLKTSYKINSYKRKMPWYGIYYIYNKLKYGRLPY